MIRFRKDFGVVAQGVPSHPEQVHPRPVNAFVQVHRAAPGGREQVVLDARVTVQKFRFTVGRQSELGVFEDYGRSCLCIVNTFRGSPLMLDT